MIIGNVIGWDSGADDLFNIHSIRNRDDCLEPFRQLQQEAQKQDIIFHTPDVNQQLGLTPHFNFYVDSVDVCTRQPNYLLMLETPQILPRNEDENYLAQFQMIFTWNDNLIDGKKFQKIFFPNPPSYTGDVPFSHRPDFMCMIAGNKFVNQPDIRELYSQRVAVIKWFEKHHPTDFKLYGTGWNKPQRAKNGIEKWHYRLKKIQYKLQHKPPFPSYQGPLVSKKDALLKTKFSICFENIRDVPGYITEKIFDSFFSGCVPVYWGMSHVNELIPQKCFVDFREFNDIALLYEYLKKMNQYQYLEYQEAIKEFLFSEQFFPFSSHAFAQKIVKEIKKVRAYMEPKK